MREPRFIDDDGIITAFSQASNEYLKMEVSGGVEVVDGVEVDCDFTRRYAAILLAERGQ